MRHALAVLAIVAAVAVIATSSTAAHAGRDCPVDKKLKLRVACRAELVGLDSAKVNLADQTRTSALEVIGPSKRVALTWGEWTLSGELQCIGASTTGMDWELTVDLRTKSQVSSVHYARVGNLDLANRRGKPPLAVTSFYFFEPAIPNPNKPGGKLTRIDYTCELHVE